LRLLFKLLLALFEIRETLGQRLVLFAELFGLSLDIRELIGVTGRRKGEHSHRRQKNLFHLTPPSKGATRIIREPAIMMKPRMRFP
jgi:hypothetical protein